MASVIGLSRTSANNLILSILPETTTLNSNDLFVIEDGTTGELKKITKANLQTALSLGGVGFAPKNIVTAQKINPQGSITLYKNIPLSIVDLSVTITPHTDTSKILLSGHIFGEFNPYNGGETVVVALSRQISGGSITFIPRDPDANAPGASGVAWFGINYPYNADTTGEHASFQYIDSPATTSPVTYRVYLYQSRFNAVDFYFNQMVNPNITDLNEYAISFVKAEDDYQSLAATISSS